VKPVLVVTGTRREAAVLQEPGIRVLCGGGDPAGLAAALAVELPGAAGIVSFGMAGALDPALRIGDWVIGEEVVAERPVTCNSDWIAALANALPQARFGPVLGGDTLISKATSKAALFSTTGAVCADMESHVAAAAAARTGLPLAVLRCISDEAEDDLPPVVGVAMAPGGKLAPGAILASLAGYPGQLPALFRTLSRFNRAYRAIRLGAAQFGPRLAYPGS